MKTVEFFRLKERSCPYRESMGGRHIEDKNHNGFLQLQKGIEVEKEHKGTIDFLKRHVKKHGKFPKEKKIYKSIAKEHLKEDSKYYKKLAELEKD